MDIKMHYIEKGRGKTLILLHGNGENSDYFVNQISFFANDYRVISIDTRGHGKTPRGSRPFTIAQFADDLYDFMNEMNIEKSSILGFSDGGNIAIDFVLKYPQKVESLILNGANLNTAGLKKSVQLPIEIGYKIACLFAGKSQKAFKNKEMLGLMVNDPDIDVNELHKINTPVLVIAGTKDMIKDSHTRLIAANIKNAELSIIKGSHFIANKSSEKFNDVVSSFLKRNI